MELCKPVVAVIQARMGSSRLEGKVLKEVLGRPLLDYLIERLKRAISLDQLLIATTQKERDDPIVFLAKKRGVRVFRGSEENVLERYYLAAKEVGAKTVVRITADCPLIDPLVVDETVEAFCKSASSLDYLSNCTFRTFPRGMDTEVFSFKALEESFFHDQDPYEQEHVTPYIYRRPELFKLGQIHYYKDCHDIRLTVDTLEDFELIRRIIEALYPSNPTFSLENILIFLENNPTLLKINEHVQQKP